MSANTETTGGPPKGHRKCGYSGCERWTNAPGACWTCCTPNGPSIAITAAMVASDWSPPIAAPAAHVERRKGQRWHMRNVKLGADFSGVLAEDTGATWKLSDVVAMDGEGTDRRFRADMWATPGTTMTLLATPEPAKCEPWCGNDLPPDDVCGYGFIDGPGDEREYFKLPGKSQRRKGYLYSWCSNECREKAEVSKSPPAHEAPKAAPANPCAPVCNNRGCRLPPLARVIAGHSPGDTELVFLCDVDYLAHERGIPAESTGKPYAGPERLPKPQLAADWVEDCLPEAGR